MKRMSCVTLKRVVINSIGISKCRLEPSHGLELSAKLTRWAVHTIMNNRYVQEAVTY